LLECANCIRIGVVKAVEVSGMIWVGRDGRCLANKGFAIRQGEPRALSWSLWGVSAA